ncbi:aminotransferase class IV [Ferruginibacter sp.]
MTWFNYNGKIFTEGIPVIGTGNRSLRYGDGLFETMKIKKGALILGNEHFARLWKGLQVLQFDIPKHFTPQKLQEAILQLAAKNKQEQAARVRLTVFRGDGGLYDAAHHHPDYIIQTWALADDNAALNSNGLDLGIYYDAKKSCDILSNLKTNNFLPYAMAALEVKKQQWNDAVLLNNHGRVCDSTIANIFLIKEGVVFTPSLAEGCIEGVLRNYILQQLEANHISCREKEITVEALLQADEVFLSNSIYNMRWVKSIGNKTYSNTITQKIYSLLSPTIL